jgi:hypothetical protein
MGLPCTRIDIGGAELMKRLLGLVACCIVIIAPVMADENRAPAIYGLMGTGNWPG